MSEILNTKNRTAILWAIAAATLSGVVSAISLEPVMELMERNRTDDLFGLLSSFAFSAGLAFGLFGAAVAVWSMRVRTAAAVVFLLTSMIGMAAAVYLAMLSFDNTTSSFVLPYASGSPLGALIVAVPFALVSGIAHRWRTIVLATVLPTLWAVGVATVIDGEAALEVSGLATLYIGWQVAFLGVFAAAGLQQPAGKSA